MIDFKMVDIDGRWRHIAIPESRFVPDLMESGIGFDGSNYGFAAVEKSDMIFIPDLSSAALDPFAEVTTLSMISVQTSSTSALKQQNLTLNMKFFLKQHNMLI